MELSGTERVQSDVYLRADERLMGDERTRKTFQGISGLCRLMDRITTEAILEQCLQEQSELPPFVLHLLETYDDKVHR